MFAIFEPNDEPLWAQIRLAGGAFMNTLFRRGAFAGKTASQAYFVKADAETTTAQDQALGIVNVLVGFAPLRPAEFIVVTIQQMAGQVQVVSCGRRSGMAKFTQECSHRSVQEFQVFALLRRAAGCGSRRSARSAR